MDVTGEIYLQPEQISACYFGCWQCSHAVQSCIDGLLKLLGKFDIVTRLAETEIDQIFRGDILGKWSCDRHFSNEKRYKGPLDVPCICGSWFRHGHFVTFVLCLGYWTFLHPLNEESGDDDIVHENVKNVIKLAYETKGFEVPKLLSYKQFKRICIQKDSPLSTWSCGTFAILTTLHIIL